MSYRTLLHVFDAGTTNAHPYKDEVFEAYVKLFRSVVGLDFMFMGDNAEFTFLMIFFKMRIFVIKIVMANFVEMRNV